MSVLSRLTLSAVSPREKLTPIARKRNKLLDQLDFQIAAAEAERDGFDYLPTVRRWVRVEGSPEKQLITKPVTVRRWWWTANDGKLMVALRAGNKIIDVAPGKVSIEVGELAALPETLEALREAVAAGELDEQLDATEFARPIPKTKSAKA